jgi:hypothetical protein
MLTLFRDGCLRFMWRFSKENYRFNSKGYAHRRTPEGRGSAQPGLARPLMSLILTAFEFSGFSVGGIEVSVMFPAGMAG